MINLPLFFMLLQKKLLLVFTFTAFTLISWANADTAPSNPAGFEIHRGTNLSHWLSQDFKWTSRDEWITENDIKYIASIGFDHVRLPIDEKEMWHEDNSPNEEAFAQLREGLKWIQDAGLRVILDLHTVRAHHFNAVNDGMEANTLWTSEEAQEHFHDIWVELSARLKKYPCDFMAYEIMNEPTADDDADWNKLANESIARIRKLEPNRVIVLGANTWQIPEKVSKLDVPKGDKNIILSMHTYSPFMLTHHTANWTPSAVKDFPGPVTYPGPVVEKEKFAEWMEQCPKNADELLADTTDNWGPERFTKKFADAIKTAKALGLQLYCGEFGCLATVPREARLAYYHDIIGVFEANDIAWANWEYRGDFGIKEWHGLESIDGAPDIELIDALIQR